MEDYKPKQYLTNEREPYKSDKPMGVSIFEDLSRFDRFKKNKLYWKSLDRKKGNHLEILDLVEKMNNDSNESLPRPRFLIEYFFRYLKEHHPSQQNRPQAKSMTDVFMCLAHQYFKSATHFNMIASFWVSPNVWNNFYIGRKEVLSSIPLLKEMGLIIAYPYRLENRRDRKVIMYQFNLEKIKEIGEQISEMAYEEHDKRRDKQKAYLESSFSENYTLC